MGSRVFYVLKKSTSKLVCAQVISGSLLRVDTRSSCGIERGASNGMLTCVDSVDSMLQC